MEPTEFANERENQKNNLFWWTEPVDLEKDDLIGLKQKAENIIKFIDHSYRGRWFQNDLIGQYKVDRLIVCQESLDLM